MVAVLWVSLPTTWQLSEVQAGLQVVIALLCTWGIFAFSRFCWQLSSNLVKKNRAVALSSLMSINTIGEAYDVVALLKRRIFRQRYWKLLAQSIVVVGLTAATIVSGPIAKASTRVGTIINVETIPGWLATQSYNSRLYANVDWNDTYSSLERARFPTDQLLDYMPDQNTTWLYRESEWNNTWTMQCNKTENAPIALFDTGKCTNYSTELPATNSIWPYNSFDQQEVDWNSMYTNSSWMSDALVIFTGWTYPGYDSNTNTTYNMTVTIMALHMQNMKNKIESTSCQFGPGPVESASYTKVECFLTRPATIPDPKQVAYPDCGDTWALPQAFVSNYYDRMVTEVHAGRPVTMLAPDELIRFYQSYMITKDYQTRVAVDRYLTAEVKVVQLSSTFIAFGSLYALMVILGLINYGIFAWKHTDVMRSTPESKLDWIVQSILDETDTAYISSRQQGGRRSVYAQANTMLAELGATEKARLAFENAKYGTDEVESMPLTGHVAPLSGSIGSQNTTPGLGFSMSPPTPYGRYPGSSPDFYNLNPYEASYATQQTDYGDTYPVLQNPEHTFISDRRRGYQRLG